ncbi:hypothetical protein A4X13_0g4150 [Tilletia indica]|uniref:Uncharacterized protein n=1 Tax=Tilletia indica TaxID=43049 RepID=A0A8T8SYG7_9BASI|nr:hypothetical protein A4X13_0g4150 [Tilletia indica]
MMRPAKSKGKSKGKEDEDSSRSSVSSEDSDEEPLLPSDEDEAEGKDVEDEEVHNSMCHCELKGRITKHLYVYPPPLERDVRSDPLLILARAHALLDSLESNPATKLKHPPRLPPPADSGKRKWVWDNREKVSQMEEAKWAYLDPLLQALFSGTKPKAQDVPSEFRSSLVSLQRRLHALLKHPRINSKSFRRGLVSDEAKALSTILRRVRTIPDDYRDDDEEDDQHPFFVSLQRTSLYHVGLRYKVNEANRSLAAALRASTTLIRFQEKPIAGSDNVERVEETYCQTILRSGTQYRSLSRVRDDILRNGMCTSPDTSPEVLSLECLHWLDEGGVPFSHLLPFLGNVGSISFCRWLEVTGRVINPPSLCYFPNLHTIWSSKACDKVHARAQQSVGSLVKKPPVQKYNPMEGMYWTGSNADEVLALAKKMCEARTKEPSQGSGSLQDGRQESNASRGATKRRPPSLGALCAIVIQDVLSSQKDEFKPRKGKVNEESEAGPSPAASRWINTEAIEALAEPHQALIKHSYICVSCRVPVSGYRYDDDGDDDYSRTARRRRSSPAGTEALPPLRERRRLPRFKWTIHLAPADPSIGGKGPWLLPREAYFVIRAEEAYYHAQDKSVPAPPKDPWADEGGQSLDKRIVDWRFCAPCLVAHFEPDWSEDECGCMLCNEERYQDARRWKEFASGKGYRSDKEGVGLLLKSGFHH